MKVLHRFLPLCVFLWIAAGVGMAKAESCSDLVLLGAKITAAKLRIIKDYPGSSATIFACYQASQGQSERDKQSIMLICAAGVVFSLGFDQTANLITRAIEISEAEEWVNRKKREAGGC